jgi:hypothetical protein
MSHLCQLCKEQSIETAATEVDTAAHNGPALDEAKQLIVRSTCTDSIVHAQWSVELAEALRESSDDYSEPGSCDLAGEYWSSDWRVHLRRRS